MNRQARILGDLEVTGLRGLEVGPRHAPLVSKADGPVLYVDYASTEALRAGWTKPDIVDPASFIEVDLVWGRYPLPVVDYIVASHVIEHVPDLAGWLTELRAALRPGGLVCLAIPDRRFTFDVLRKESTLAEVVEARLAGARRPSPRQVFDSYAFTRPNDHVDAWARQGPAAPAPLPHKLAPALEMARQAAAGDYVDSHCWVFTPGSFLDLAEGMRALGWFDFEVAHFAPTLRDDLEFIVRLKAQDDAAAIEASFAAARESLAHADMP